MFTFIVCKWLKLKEDGPKMIMVFIAIFADFMLTIEVLGGLGII